MQNGQEFERILFKNLKKIESSFFIKSPTPVTFVNKNNQKKAIFTNKALCDFVGIFKTKFILIEAKTVSTRFELRRLKKHQINQLRKIEEYGGISLIIFKINDKKDINIIKINNYLKLIENRKKKSLSTKEIELNTNTIKINEIENYINSLIN